MLCLCRALGLNVSEHVIRVRYNICFPAQRMRRLLWVALRLMRRNYNAPYFMYSWHSDMNCKLVDLSIFWTGAVDGCTRALLWLEVLTDRLPLSVWPHFERAALALGVPDQLITDFGIENRLMAYACNVTHELLEERPSRPPHVAVMSVLNVRIERIWGDVNVRINRIVRLFSFFLEGHLHFNPSHPVHLGALHRVLLPALRVAARMYMDTRNNRRIKGRNAGIPLRMIASRPRPAHLHRELSTLISFPDTYPGELAEQQERARVRAYDPLQGMPAADARDAAVQEMMTPAERWSSLLRYSWVDVAAMWAVDMRLTLA